MPTLAFVLACAAMAPAGTVARADAGGGGGGGVLAQCSNGRGVFAFPSADPGKVHELGGVPSHWTLRLDDAGRAQLIVVAYECPALSIDGVARPVLYTSLASAVDPAGTVDPARRTARFSGLPDLTDYYLISWATDDLDFARWLQEDTGLHDRVRYVPDLALSWPLGVVTDVHVDAPAPTRSPFVLDARVTEPAVLVAEVTANFWAETTRGLVMIETSNPQGDRLGQGDWRLDVAPTSPLAAMIGADEVASQCATPDECFPANEASTVGRYRKDLPR